MHDKTGNPDRHDMPGPEGESFLERFHRRKTAARLAGEAAAVPVDPVEDVTDTAEPEPQPTDADMPPLESLTADSDYRGFLSPRVSDGLRRAALRKLFHGAAFNVIDEMDDYAEDFTRFEALGDIVTADMRHRLEVEARKQAEALKRAILEDEPSAEAEADGSAPDTPDTVAEPGPEPPPESPA